mmetsp:Transcript_106087/g.330903  ORF Transcript_106087/g.330903 Transcript_106087/m.330903 type:complete len:241 (-) Transcript_106087:583-1305(-)
MPRVVRPRVDYLFEQAAERCRPPGCRGGAIAEAHPHRHDQLPVQARPLRGVRLPPERVAAQACGDGPHNGHLRFLAGPFRAPRVGPRAPFGAGVPNQAARVHRVLCRVYLGQGALHAGAQGRRLQVEQECLLRDPPPRARQAAAGAWPHREPPDRKPLVGAHPGHLRAAVREARGLESRRGSPCERRPAALCEVPRDPWQGFADALAPAFPCIPCPQRGRVPLRPPVGLPARGLSAVAQA